MTSDELLSYEQMADTEWTEKEKMLDFLKVAANISSLTVFSQQLDLVEN